MHRHCLAARLWGSFSQGWLLLLLLSPPPWKWPTCFYRLLCTLDPGRARPKIRGLSFRWDFALTKILVLTLSGLAPDLCQSQLPPGLLHHVSFIFIIKKSHHLLIAYYVPDILLNALCALFHLSLLTIMRWIYILSPIYGQRGRTEA